MSDAHSIEFTGPRPDWMPTCARCSKQVEGVVMWDEHIAKRYEANCHGERAELLVSASELLKIKRDIEGYLQRRVRSWSPFPLLS